MIQDIQEFKPTLFGTFPLFFSKMVKKIERSIEGKGAYE
jgi:long-subunit acyl-CoA synthetase (AMP-forming)